MPLQLHAPSLLGTILRRASSYYLQAVVALYHPHPPRTLHPPPGRHSTCRARRALRTSSCGTWLRSLFTCSPYARMRPLPRTTLLCAWRAFSLHLPYLPASGGHRRGAAECDWTALVGSASVATVAFACCGRTLDGRQHGLAHPSPPAPTYIRAGLGRRHERHRRRRHAHHCLPLHLCLHPSRRVQTYLRLFAA